MAMYNNKKGMESLEEKMASFDGNVQTSFKEM